MENIVEINEDFDFNSLYLENPIPLQGGSFFTKINYSDKKLPLYLQLPKCRSKNGILKSTTSKKSYIDLLFNFNEEGLSSWFENLESKCRDLIFSKKDNWFQSDMDLDDIENMFITPIRSFKSGKYISLRVNIPYTRNIKKEYCMIYDETEKILDSKDVTYDKDIIPLVLIDGIRFTSKTFQLEINLPQLMILNIDNNIKNNFMIKSGKSDDNNKIQETDKNIESKENNVIDNNTTILDKSEIINDSLIAKSVMSEVLAESSNEEINNKITNVSSLSNKLKDYDSKSLEKEKSKVNLDSLEEIDLEVPNGSEEFLLKNPIEVYSEIYKTAKNKAKQLKIAAMTAFLEAREIKVKYNLEDSDISDEEVSNNT